MQPIPLIHRSALTPAIAILEDLGAPTEKLLRAQKLPAHDYEQPTGYVHVLDVWAFVDQSSDSQALWDFGFRIAERVTVQRASRWGPRVAAAPTLQAAIETMGKRIRADIPDIRVGLEKRGDELWFWRDHVPDRRACPGYWVGDQYMIAFMVQIVRMALGADWYPSRLEVQMPSSAWKDERPEIAGDAKIAFGSPRTAVELPAGSLGRRLNGPKLDFAIGLPDADPSLPASDLAGSLRQVLRSLACEENLNIQLGAEILRTSERSLRRHLASEGTTWRELVDRVRLESSLDLMEVPSISLVEVAARLGYSQYPHFYRAFRRWTGQTPRDYRRTLEAL